jgi:hypothetical protein
MFKSNDSYLINIRVTRSIILNQKQNKLLKLMIKTIKYDLNLILTNEVLN